MKNAIKVLISIVGIFIFILLSLLAWLTLTDYKPAEIETLKISNNSGKSLPEEFTILNWNIGYGALGADADFFFDGGETVITPKDDYNRYKQGILNFVDNTDADVYYFQEVDTKSKRSHYDDQYEQLSDILPNYSRTFAVNYQVAFIPPPALFKTSMGVVNAGLAMFSKFDLDESARFSLPGGYSWPKSTLFLDRCMIVSRITTEDGANVVLINTHNSAYDQGGFIKRDQLQFIKKFAEKEYEAGNYVIIGGDWNSYMPGTDGDTFKAEEKASVYNQGMPDGWEIKDWNWGFDPTVSSSRSLLNTYKKGRNFECVIDGFLLSPNIKIKKVLTHDLGFKFSDHNPVEITVELK